jgi:hypothetical protein
MPAEYSLMFGKLGIVDLDCHLIPIERLRHEDLIPERMMPNNWLLTYYMYNGGEDIEKMMRLIAGVDNSVNLDSLQDDSRHPSRWAGPRDIEPNQ